MFIEYMTPFINAENYWFYFIKDLSVYAAILVSG